MRDSDVQLSGDSLKGKVVHLVVTGGIAAVETVRLARELRRHGAEIIVTMTSEATKIISPLAVGWATGSEVNTGWSSDLPGLDSPDLVLVAPATRNTLSKICAGVMDDPAMMAITAASGAGKTILLVPSMHDDLFDDAVTRDMIETIKLIGYEVLVSPSEEGRRKQPSPSNIVRFAAAKINENLPNRANIAVIYGATESSIDPVRVISNKSSGKTGIHISDYLERLGHGVTRISGIVENSEVQSDINARTPQQMMDAVRDVMSKSMPNVWIVPAAVLDFQPANPSMEKMSSSEPPSPIDIEPSPRLIEYIRSSDPDARIISFKLENGIEVAELIARARSHMKRCESNAVVANLLENLEGPGPRAHLVTENDVDEISDLENLCISIERIVSRWME
ncbi:MAG: phosphopantothenoylcysteine decarboxylase [Candidatus Thalassarchaeaceae archaeon]